MITAQWFLLTFVVRQVETNLEAAGDALPAAERVEERMEVGAVALADFARVSGAAEAPARVVFVVGHFAKDVIVNRSRLLQRALLACNDLAGQIANFIVHEH